MIGTGHTETLDYIRRVISTGCGEIVIIVQNNAAACAVQAQQIAIEAACAATDFHLAMKKLAHRFSAEGIAPPERPRRERRRSQRQAPRADQCWPAVLRRFT